MIDRSGYFLLFQAQYSIATSEKCCSYYVCGGLSWRSDLGLVVILPWRQYSQEHTQNEVDQ